MLSSIDEHTESCPFCYPRVQELQIREENSLCLFIRLAECLDIEKISLEMTGIGSYIVMAVAKPKSIRTEQIILENLTPDEKLA